MRSLIAAFALCLISASVVSAGETAKAAADEAVAAAQSEALECAEKSCAEKSACRGAACGRVRGTVVGSAKVVKNTTCGAVEATARVVQRAGRFSFRTFSRVRTRVVRGRACSSCN